MPELIRRAVAGDAARLALVAAATFPFACPPHTLAGGIKQFISTTLSEESFAAYLGDPARVLFVAENDGLPVGYTMLVLGEPTDADVAAAITVRPTAELSKCYVVTGQRGSGVAGRLMDASVDAARENGASAVWLGVNDENDRANRFYEKNGFAVVGTKSFRLGDRLESDFVRERVL